MQIALTKAYQRSLSGLGPAQQAAVNDTILKLDDGNKSVHPHKLADSGFVSLVVNRDALRIVCIREGDTYVLLHVNNHDAAYQWAVRHRVAQVGTRIRILEVERGQLSAADAEQALPPGPLAEHPDKVFRHFSIGPMAASVLRQVPDEEHLLELVENFKPPQADALLDLASDPEDLAKHVLSFERALEEDTRVQPSIAQAITAPENQGELWILPPEHQALKAALEAGGDAWRVFLHPSQRKLVEWKVKGAMQVSGGPGTGKTVVMLHRARFLAEQVFQDGAILLTTFSRALAEQLERDLARLCADRPKLLERFEVRTLTGLAREILTQAAAPEAFLDDEIVSACWDQAMNLETLGKSRAFYVAEREGVLARNGTWSMTSYARVRRTGRGSRLKGVTERKAVWAVVDAFESALLERGGGDAYALARRATQSVASGTVTPGYVSVLCDEVQDASADELRLLAALSAEPGSTQTRPNALFLCGDGYQRLYRSPVPLSACNIDIRGRSRKLRLNYRTTEGIRAQAVAMVSGHQLDELDAESGQDALKGYRSLRGGPLPEKRSFGTAAEEADWVASLASGEEEGPLLVMARTKRWLEQLTGLLVERGLSPSILGKNSTELQPLTLCTLHRAKGLEAPRAVLVGMQQSPMGYRGGSGDKQDKVLWERKERSLVYVGMTRARDWCGVSCVNKVEGAGD